MVEDKKEKKSAMKPDYLFEKAVYHHETEPAFIGNPLIEALPSIGEPDDYLEKLMVMPLYSEEDRGKSDRDRLLCLPTMKNLHMPVKADTEIALNIDRCLHWGYYGRNPMPISVIQKAYEDAGLPFDSHMQRLITSYKQPTYGFPVFGISGVGKTCSVMNVLTLYPQVIVHTQYRGVPFLMHQLVWLQVDCPDDGSTKGLCIRILRTMDKVLGTDFAKMHSSSRVSKDVLLDDVREAIDTCGLGILVIDDIQNLCDAKNQISRELLNFMVSLVNTVGIPIIMIGTPKFIPLLQAEFQQAKRATGEGEIRMDLMASDTKEWERFMTALWHYQYTREKVELTKEMRNAFYEETVGNPFLASILYKLVQDEAIISHNETFTPENVHSVADFRLGITKQQRKDMLNGKDFELNQYLKLWAPAVPAEKKTADTQSSQKSSSDIGEDLAVRIMRDFHLDIENARKVSRQTIAASADLKGTKDMDMLLGYAAAIIRLSENNQDTSAASDSQSHGSQ